MSTEPDPARLEHVLAPTPPTQRSAQKRLKRIAAHLPCSADLILVGDSLAAGWPADLIHDGGRQILNFGLPGDRIQHTLWRLDAIATAHLRPERVLVLLGTNNLGDGDAPEAIAAGLRAVLVRVWCLWGEPDRVLVSIPQRGLAPGFREPDRLRTNALLASEAATLCRTTLIDADLVLETGFTKLRDVTEPDLLHLNREGYRRLAAALNRNNGSSQT
jgi:lysophospholipase L1-like esterase